MADSEQSRHSQGQMVKIEISRPASELIMHKSDSQTEVSKTPNKLAVTHNLDALKYQSEESKISNQANRFFHPPNLDGPQFEHEDAVNKVHCLADTRNRQAESGMSI